MQHRTPSPIRITLGVPEECRVQVGDLDITDSVVALRVDADADPRTLPLVTLQLHGEDVQLDGLAIVAAEGSGPTARDALDMLRSMDPAELKARALRTGGLGGPDVVTSVLALAIEDLEQAWA